MTMRGSSGCRTAALTAAFGLVGAPASAQALDHLFKSGQEGYRCFRIPAIVATASSTLLVIAEGRKAGGGDAGDIDLVVKRSHDGGETRSELKGDETLVSLVSQANLIWYGHQGRMPSLAFSKPASRDAGWDVTVFSALFQAHSRGVYRFALFLDERLRGLRAAATCLPGRQPRRS
jgi:hypothetical protein